MPHHINNTWGTGAQESFTLRKTDADLEKRVTYREKKVLDRVVFRTLSNRYDGVFCEIVSD